MIFDWIWYLVSIWCQKGNKWLDLGWIEENDLELFDILVLDLNVGFIMSETLCFWEVGFQMSSRATFPWQEDNLSQENLNLERKISTEWSQSSIFSSSCPFVLSPIPKWEWMLSERSKVRWMVTLLKALRLIWSLLGIHLKGFALSLQVDKWPDWMRARPQDCDSFLLQSSHLRLTSFRATSNPVYL